MIAWKPQFGITGSKWTLRWEVCTPGSFRSHPGRSSDPRLYDGPCECTMAQVLGQCSHATSLAAAATAFLIFLQNIFVSLLPYCSALLKSNSQQESQQVSELRRLWNINYERGLQKTPVPSQNKFLFISKSHLPKHIYTQFSSSFLNWPMKLQLEWCWRRANPPQPCSGTVSLREPSKPCSTWQGSMLQHTHVRSHTRGEGEAAWPWQFRIPLQVPQAWEGLRISFFLSISV